LVNPVVAKSHINDHRSGRQFAGTGAALNRRNRKNTIAPAFDHTE
jgi:hypothetical protein